nr:MAG TPA: hypothetical protein [Caudoviricetes sp.]
MNRTVELLFDIIETYQRHAKIAKNAKYRETREMAEMIIDVDISAMWFLTQRIPDTRHQIPADVT